MRVFFYGSAAEQFVRLHLPTSSEIHESNSTRSPHPVCAVIHGGYWKNQYDLDSYCIKNIAPALARRGYAAVEVEYRRRDHPGGGWPGTNVDVVLALRYLSDLADPSSAALPLDLSRLVIMGHSAGGCLAMWAAEESHRMHATGAVDTDGALRLSEDERQRLEGWRAVVPHGVVAIAPVADLIEGYEQKLSDEGDAVERYMKMRPTDSVAAREAYMRASPAHQLPNRVPQALILGRRDTGHESSVRLYSIESADHFDLVDCDNKKCFETLIEAVEGFIHT
ncbi:unnamed protein product [Vitrella brassicaformis CCMP3155]|uniref:BD-FAE-like domain-containing protein n=1 Tax=Vitrella brassicaformis (strain CCMP3155) TaxID=1169540 RepID=A0A0G4GFB1_VITBC|nr:unnamed protein product [Vitrella brassicaformis CCMP3155]|eukprot:CEM27843.1 unnamed protein product [Vitrella brassicaformis CCMP3155]